MSKITILGFGDLGIWDLGFGIWVNYWKMLGPLGNRPNVNNLGLFIGFKVIAFGGFLRRFLGLGRGILKWDRFERYKNSIAFLYLGEDFP